MKRSRFVRHKSDRMLSPPGPGTKKRREVSSAELVAVSGRPGPSGHLESCSLCDHRWGPFEWYSIGYSRGNGELVRACYDCTQARKLHTTVALGQHRPQLIASPGGSTAIH